MLDVDQIAIIGTGLLGASLGLALRAGGYRGRMVGVGRRPATLNAAVAAGAIDRGVTDLGAVARDTRLAVVAVPLGGFAAVFDDLARHDHPDLYVTDLGSTKASVVATAQQRLPDPSRFCGAHPMAGGEGRGPQAADARLFAGKPCVLTPGPDTSARAVALAEALWGDTLGMRLQRMDPAAHDRAVAGVSHLPHLLAVLLMNVADERGGLDLASTGLRDTGRLAASNPPMRRDIVTQNRAAVLESLDAFDRHLKALRSVLQRADDDTLLATLEHARGVRANWLAGVPALTRPSPNPDRGVRKENQT